MPYEIVCNPNEQRNTHHLMLSKDGQEVGLILCNTQGARDDKRIGRRPYPSTASIKTYSGEPTHADSEPPFSPVEQKNWTGGRGQMYFEEDTSKFLDSYRLITYMQGKVFLAGQETYSVVNGNTIQKMPGSVSWVPLLDPSRFLARSFSTGSAAFPVRGIEAWVRKVGNPGTLYASIRANGEDPGLILFEGTITAESAPDTLSTLQHWDLETTDNLPPLTAYYVVFNASPGDNAANHWEIGIDLIELGMRTGTGTPWTIEPGAPYFRVLDLTVPYDAMFFDYKGQLYAVARESDMTGAKILMNGYRGMVSPNADRTLLVDDTQELFGEFTPDWRVSIYDGAGTTEIQNWRKVIDGDNGTLVCSPAWNENHEAAGANITQYNVLGANTWQTRETIPYPVQDVAVAGEMAWFACGEEKYFSSIRPVVKFQEFISVQQEVPTMWLARIGTEQATQASYVKAIYDPIFGYYLYLARNNDADEDVTITRKRAPQVYTEFLDALRPYYSASPNGFMTELQDTLQDTASDSFNRANGALGATDGNADPNHAGGAGVAWSLKTGTIVIESNQAKCTAVTADRAIATLGAGNPDVVVSAKAGRAGGNVGVLVRYVDLANYILVYHNGTNFKVLTRVDDTETIIVNQVVPYVPNAEIRAETAGSRLRIFYHGTKIGGDYTITEAALQGGTLVGLYSSVANNLFDDFYTYPNGYRVIPSGNSAHIEVAPGLGIGLIATDKINNEDWRRYTKLLITIKCSKNMSGGELELLIDNTSLCGSPIHSVPLPALSADVTYNHDTTRNANLEFDLAAIQYADEIQSVGLKLTQNPSEAFDIDVTFKYLDPGEKIIRLGDKATKITGLERYGDPETLWVFKEDSLWEVTNNIAHQIPIRALESVKSSDNGRGHVVHDLYLMFSLDDGWERYYRQNLDDIGPNRGEGLPIGRQGKIVHAVDYPAGIICALDGGYEGISSVLLYNEEGWHELYRAPRLGLRIRRVHIQAIPGTSISRLWISQGRDILWIPMALSPLNAREMRFTHEGVLETCRYSLSRRNLDKYIDALELVTENLTDEGIEILSQYRTDESPGWTNIPAVFNQSPAQERNLSPSNNVCGKWIQFRHILRTNENTISPVLLASVIKMIVQEPIKWAYDVVYRIKDRDHDLLGNEDPVPGPWKLAQLDQWMADPEPVQLAAWSKVYHNRGVKIQPASSQHLVTIQEDGVDVDIYRMTLLEV